MADLTKRSFRFNSSPVLSAAIVILPLVIFGIYFYWTTYKSLQDFTVSKREALSQLSAVIIKERFDRLIDVGNSLASRVQFRNLISQSKWDDAIKIIAAVPQTTPFIERVALLDISGTAKALAPDFPGIVGKNFAHRDYYQGISRDWKPYISEVFKGATNQNSIVFAIPIKSDDNKILGILVLQIVTDTFLDWVKHIDVGPGGFVYFVDRSGNLVAHPHYSPQEEIVSFAKVPVVEKLLKGEEGAEILYNPVEKEERLSAYSPVSGYGFGVVVAQPTRIAFYERNIEVIKLSAIFLVLIAGLWLSAYLIFKNQLIIEAQRDRERIFLESIGDGVVAIDRFWNIALWNKEAGLLSGWNKEEVLGKPFRNFLKFMREQDRSENVHFIEEAMLFGRKSIMENNTLLIRKDGSEIPAGDSASPIFDQNGVISGAIIIFRDISQEREFHRLRSDFAFAAHQFRTPITKALWNIEVALDEKNSKSRKENLQDAYLSIQSVNKLANHLLDTSELDQKQTLLKFEGVKLADLFGAVLKQLEKFKNEKGITIIGPVFEVTNIITDPNLLKKSLYEILDNAIRYSKNNGEIKISAVLQENNILIKIQDFGIGIPKDQQQLIFTKFFRGKNIPLDSIGGGLGLYVARECLKLLKGKIWFESEEGAGATFLILLPIE